MPATSGEPHPAAQRCGMCWSLQLCTSLGWAGPVVLPDQVTSPVCPPASLLAAGVTACGTGCAYRYHLRCVGLTQAAAAGMKRYTCPYCAALHSGALPLEPDALAKVGAPAVQSARGSENGVCSSFA